MNNPEQPIRSTVASGGHSGARPRPSHAPEQPIRSTVASGSSAARARDRFAYPEQPIRSTVASGGRRGALMTHDSAPGATDTFYGCFREQAFIHKERERLPGATDTFYGCFRARSLSKGWARNLVPEQPIRSTVASGVPIRQSSRAVHARSNRYVLRLLPGRSSRKTTKSASRPGATDTFYGCFRGGRGKPQISRMFRRL